MCQVSEIYCVWTQNGLLWIWKDLEESVKWIIFVRLEPDTILEEDICLNSSRKTGSVKKYFRSLENF